MEIAKSFFTGLLIYILYKIGLTPPDFDRIFRQREEACQDCPLRRGNFCSKKTDVKIINNKLLLDKHPTGIITGCGCFLPFKRSVNSECPMDKWLKYNGK